MGEPLEPPSPYWVSDEGDVTLYLGDCLAVLPSLPENSVDAVVCDPPYDLTSGKKGGSGEASLNEKHPAGRSRITTGGGFMGREWDATGVAFDPATWREVLRVLKPGGHLLAFGGTRTWHRMVCAIEDAGFEIRDSIDWIYGSGFPKSLDVSKAIDKAAGAEREVVGKHSPAWGGTRAAPSHEGWQRPWMDEGAARDKAREITAPATEDAARWEGWGTALKPAHEPIAVARKSPAGTVAANVLAYGTGALNIAACLVAHASEADLSASLSKNPGRDDTVTSGTYGADRPQQSVNTEGRWPPNILLTHSPDCRQIGTRQVRNHGHGPASRGAGGIGTSGHSGQEGLTERRVPLETVEAWDCASDCPVAELDRQSGNVKAGGSAKGTTPASGTTGAGIGPGSIPMERTRNFESYGDAGGASRFFPVFRYEAKADAAERPRLPDGTAWPTVKPVALIQWLVRLVTPSGGRVLDPFCGTGTLGEACEIEGFDCILIDRDPQALALTRIRLSKPIQPTMLTVDDSAQPARPHPVAAASRPKPPPEVHPSLFDDLDAAS